MTNSSNEPTATTKPPLAHFYRVVWRWHFYAGLFVVPFMVMLSVTGIIYLFKPQLDWLMYRELMYVTPQAQPALSSEQLAAVRQAYPAAQITAFEPSAQPNRSAVATIKNDRELAVYVNPYTKQVLGAMDSQWNLQAIAVRLHGELMIGRVGDWLIELASCWGLVLLVSGMYLWWPRKSGKLWGVVLPRLQWKNQRVFWRDLHSVFGFYGVLIVAFLLLTGLPWAGFWGTNFARVWNQYPAQQSRDIPKSTVAAQSDTECLVEPVSRAALLTGTLNTTAHKAVPWAVEQMPLPRSNPAPGHEHHAAPSTPEAQASSHRATHRIINLDTVVALAREKGVREGFTVTFPNGADGVYTIAAPTDDPLRQATLHVDQYSGNVLADVRWRDYGLVPKATEMGIVLHEGVYFGWANQLLMLFGALIVILLAVSGTVMWWQRRPAKTLGAPAMPANFPLWKGAVAIILVMGLLFPMVGNSLLAVLLLDYLVLSRIPRLKMILG